MVGQRAGTIANHSRAAEPANQPVREDQAGKPMARKAAIVSSGVR